MAPATVVAAACLAVTGYVCAQAGIDGVAAIGDMTGGHRPPPSNGVVSGIKSLVGSPAFAAAMSKASSAAAASSDSGVATSRDVSPDPSRVADGGHAQPSHGSGSPGITRALTARDWEPCLPAIAACVDLTGRVPWPRGAGADGYGPVPPSPARG